MLGPAELDAAFHASATAAWNGFLFEARRTITP
jgi:hypothetical protein